MKWSTTAPASPWPARLRSYLRDSGLGISSMAYVGVDYLRILSPNWHARLQPVLWTVLALAAVSRIPYYKHWPAELRSALPFVASMLFLLSTLLFEALSVRFVTAVLGLNWHRNTSPLPDTGQWLLLALNEKLPQTVVEILRARIIGLHHFLMLFVMLAFSVLFDSVKAPGLGLGARYMFTMAIGRLLRAISFLSTILPSARPWCASARFKIPAHPHRWAQKYYVPYASDSNAIKQLINLDMAYDTVREYTDDKRPDWGSMSFLINFLRPTVYDGSWYSLLKKAGGGCNDLLYSGHVLVAVLTAMAWTEAYGGFSSAALWLLVMHSIQREIRERHHYSVDCVVALYVGILLWKMTSFIYWPVKNTAKEARLDKLDKIQGRLLQAAKDYDIDEVRELLKEVELGSGNESQTGIGKKSKGMWLFSVGTIFFALVIVLLAFTLTSDG
ncbi:protein PHLOEM UNLOADING MODULATOR [Impatiens glandulifera]|uniref:protein PHLOEM UNLOADING MODULATOR n=1 Tax=Impatiens glandulifera TaxID=253017 RepID=UPI001FB1666E|nr:protein PHLOEM UNLOADING MODULATOR [Impatiens glandulifera]